MSPRDDIDFRHSRAILIGTENYFAGFENRRPMPAARNSLEEMRALLTGPCEWPEDQVSTFLDWQDSGSVLRTMTSMIQDVTDVLLFYYVGHGQLLAEGGNRHDLGLALTDTREEQAHRALTSLRFREVRSQVEISCRARIKIFILDCCCSGIATKYAEPGGGRGLSMDDARSGTAGVYVWSACGHSQETYFETEPGGLTYFTRFLAEAVGEAHEGPPPGATIADLDDQVRECLGREEGLRELDTPVPSLLYSGRRHGFLFVRSRSAGYGSGAFSFKPLEDIDPQRVGSYEIRARIGRGAVGQVFLAFSPEGRPIAVKLLRPELGEDQEFRSRFSREIDVAQRVHSPYVARVVGNDPNAKAPWLASEYVCGPSLHELVRESGPLPTRGVFWVAAGIAHALDAIHKVGAIHRDLKPANIMLDDKGPKVIDFGIAKAVAATQVTRTNVQPGTPAYKSPEQATGQRTITARSDVFALGSTMYFMATGIDLFGGDDPLGVAFRIAREDPDLSAVRDENLRNLIQLCLAKVPTDRPSPARVAAICEAAIDPVALDEVLRIGTAATSIRARNRALRAAWQTPPPRKGTEGSTAGENVGSVGWVPPTSPPPVLRPIAVGPNWSSPPPSPPPSPTRAFTTIFAVAAAFVLVVLLVALHPWQAGGSDNGNNATTGNLSESSPLTQSDTSNSGLLGYGDSTGPASSSSSPAVVITTSTTTTNPPPPTTTPATTTTSPPQPVLADPCEGPSAAALSTYDVGRGFSSAPNPTIRRCQWHNASGGSASYELVYSSDSYIPGPVPTHITGVTNATARLLPDGMTCIVSWPTSFGFISTDAGQGNGCSTTEGWADSIVPDLPR